MQLAREAHCICLCSSDFMMRRQSFAACANLMMRPRDFAIDVSTANSVRRLMLAGGRILFPAAVIVCKSREIEK